MSNKVELLPQISELMPSILKTVGMTKKEYRRGLELMVEAANWYWHRA